MSRSEADEMLERKKISTLGDFLELKVQINRYICQSNNRPDHYQAGKSAQKGDEKDQKLKTTCNPTHQCQSGFFSP